MSSFQVVLSFDVEEHWRIEAAHGLTVDTETKDYYASRVAPPTQWILEQLARYDRKATFFIVGELAKEQPGLVKEIYNSGHEVASHGWDHRRIHVMTPEDLHRDLKQSIDVLEQITGEKVVGYRAPTFSLVRKTAWAIDVLADQGLLYDSSIYPVRHDRYGIAEAPRGPFFAQGSQKSLLELPPVRLDLLRMKVPMGGGGYFRLFPLFFTERAIRQVERTQNPPLAMLYFHPWEFDPEQKQLPLSPVSRFRTYVGMKRSRQRLAKLIRKYPSITAREAATTLKSQKLPTFCALPSENGSEPKK